MFGAVCIAFDDEGYGIAAGKPLLQRTKNLSPGRTAVRAWFGPSLAREVRSCQLQ
jgi:hypothetical protein